MQTVRDTTKVSLVFLNGSVAIKNFLHYYDSENRDNDILSIEKSKMNKSKFINCVDMKLRISDDIIATLKIYPIKIEMKYLRPVSTALQIIKDELDSLNIIYTIKDYEKIDITLDTLGDAYDIHDVEKIILESFKNKNINTSRMIAKFNSMKIHITGLRYNKQISITMDKFFQKFSAVDTITSKLNMKYIRYIMSNLSYFLGGSIAIWEFITNINTIPGFEKAFCIYENLEKAYVAIIIVPLDINDRIKDTLWRNNIEVSYAIKNTGNITQSCPSDECGLLAFEMITRAYNILKYTCSRIPSVKRR